MKQFCSMFTWPILTYSQLTPSNQTLFPLWNLLVNILIFVYNVHEFCALSLNFFDIHLWIRRSLVAEICGPGDLWIQISLDLEICRSRYLWICRSVDPKVCGFGDLWIYRSVDLEICGSGDLWIWRSGDL